MSEGTKAVFLSYASQDSEAAKRICEALRNGGVEVWCDIEGGLETGDVWDAKIRRQIKECVLFIPIISANTQAREEGYFRIEWDLAAERARAIASGVAFILPIVIDDTREPEALVPDRFRAVQWTPARDGDLSPEQRGKFLKLWSHRTGVLKHDAADRRSASSPPMAAEAGPEGSTRRVYRPIWRTYAWLAVATLVLAACAAWWTLRKAKPAPVSATVSSISASPSKPSAAITSLSTTSPARQMANQALQLALSSHRDGQGMATAVEMAERAIQLDKLDGEVWAYAARVDLHSALLGFDNSAERHKQIRAKVARAKALAPLSFNSRVVEAQMLTRLDGLPEHLSEAERILRELGIETKGRDEEMEVLGHLAIVWSRQARNLNGKDALSLYVASAEACERAGEKISGWMHAASVHYVRAGRWDRALAAAEKLTAQDRELGLYEMCLVLTLQGDLAAARVTLQRLSPDVRREQRTLTVELLIAFFTRDSDGMLKALRLMPDEQVNFLGLNGPVRLFTGWAHHLAGRVEAARLEWQEGLRSIEQALQTDSTSPYLRQSQFYLLALLGRTAEADQVAGLLRQLNVIKPSGEGSLFHAFRGDREETLRQADREAQSGQIYSSLWSHWRYAPIFDFMRSDLRWQKLLRDHLPHGAKPFDDPTPHTPDAEPASSPPADSKSVAVLAFANLSEDKANEYFSDGISEELLNVLAKVPGLKVSARTSAFYFKGKEVPIPEIAKQLGVAYVVEGSVRKQGDKVRITAQLIKAADGFHVWSDTFTRDLKDIFAVQDEIAGLISQQLQVKLGSSGPVRSVNPEALNLLLEARHHWNERGEQNFDRAELLLRRALELDSGFARAHAALADVWLMRATYRLLDGGADVSDELRNLRVSASRATELDPSLVDPIAARAYGLMLENRMEESGRLFAEVMARSPDNPTFLYWRGLYLMNQGDFRGAREVYEKARRYDPMSFIIWHNSAECANALGRYREAATQAARSNEVRKGGFVQSVVCQAVALWLVGDQEQALALARSTRQPEVPQLRWVTAPYATWILRQAGFEAEAAAYEAEELSILPARSYQRGFLLASQGRFAEAYPYLESMPPYIFYLLATSVLFDPCREDPEFKALLEKLHWTTSYAKARAARVESLASLEVAK